MSKLSVIKMCHDEPFVNSYTEVIDYHEGFINWGIENNAPKYYRSLMRKSGLHSTIVQSKARYIGGNGFKKESLSEAALDFIKNELNDLDLEEILARISLDMEIYGGYALNVIWDSSYDFIERIEYIKVGNVRIYRKDGVDTYYYSDDWSNLTRYPKRPFPAFNPEGNEEQSTILLILASTSDESRFYPEPGYVAAIDSIETEGDIKMFQKNNIKNGFFPSIMITDFANGGASDDDKDDIEKHYRKQFQGAVNAGQVMISFAPSADLMPKVEPIKSNDADKIFIEMRKSVRESILETHQVTNPELFGVKTPGELGGSQDMVADLAKFQADYVGPKQQEIEKIINWLAAINGVTDKIEIEIYKLAPKVDVTQLLSVLSAPISSEQKVMIFQAMGFDQEYSTQLATSQTTTPNNENNATAE